MKQYAIQGYRVGALDYLLKPVSYFALSQRLDKVLQQLRRRRKQYVTFVSQGNWYKLELSQLYYIECQNHTLYYHTHSGNFPVNGTMKNLEREMEPYGCFFRCGKGYLVNLEHIDAVQDNCAVVAGQLLPISRGKKSALLGGSVQVSERRDKLMISHDIPRLYTAFAEWGACVLYILLSPKRYSRPVTVVICAFALAVQCALLELTAGILDWRWVLFMALAVLLMHLQIVLCCHLPPKNSTICCVRAFLLAEFSASMGWQIYAFVCKQRGVNPGTQFFPELVFLLAVYALVWGVMFLLEQRYARGFTIQSTSTELGTALFLGLSIFVLSNLSFLNSDTPFSAQNAHDIFYVRTLVDLLGVVSLFAYHIQHMESYTRYELSVTNALLESQYQQFRISRQSIDLLNRKYHDFKRQIAALRQETDSRKRKDRLDEMEAGIRQYEAENKTGNAVLDILLTARSLYCQEMGITLTCVADGTLLNFLSTMDLCAIVGNALDNAIESTSQVEDAEQRLIHLSISAFRGFVLLRVENYFGGSLRFEDGLPQTTKADPEFHGFGVKGIRDTVERCGGTLSMETERGWFVLQALFPQPTGNHPQN